MTAPREIASGSTSSEDAVLCLPILFAAGMSLFDTLDSSLMTFTYGRTWASPVRADSITTSALRLFPRRSTGFVVVGSFAIIWLGAILRPGRRRLSLF